MKKNNILVSLLCLSSLATIRPIISKDNLIFQKLPVPSQHYQQEYTFDTTSNPEHGVHKKKACMFPLLPLMNCISEPKCRSWKKKLYLESNRLEGRKTECQVLVWSPDTLQQVRFIVSDLKNSNGN